MKTKSILILLSSMLLISFTSCKCQKDKTLSQEVRKMKTVEAEFGKKPESISFTVDTVWVENLLLHADITYTGGQTDLEFDLVFDGAWLRSFPPKANMNIVSNPTSVKGSTKIKHHLVFDLSPLTGNQPFEVIVNGYEKNFRIGKLDIE